MAAPADVKNLLSEWKGSDGPRFERLWTKCFKKQFNQKLKPSGSCFPGKVQITDYVMEGSGSKTKKKFEFDGFVGLLDDHAPFDIHGNRTPTIINFEYSVSSSSNSLDYWTKGDVSKPSDGKLIKLLKFMDLDATSTTRKERYERIQEKKKKLPTAEDFSIAYLVGIDRNREVNLEENHIQIQANLAAAFPGRTIKVGPIDGTGAITVEMDDFSVVAGVLGLGACADHMTTILALDKHLFQKTQTTRRYFDRLLCELTSKLAGETKALAALEPFENIAITLLSNEQPDTTTKKYSGEKVKYQGEDITAFRFRIELRELIRMCQVERTLNEIGALQRIPQTPHMKLISDEGIDLDKIFVNPVVVSTNSNFDIFHNEHMGEVQIIPDAAVSYLSPYVWTLIDGQHRIFAGYYSDLENKSLTNFSFDVVLYKFRHDIPDSTRRDINSEIFFDLNYRTLPPNDEIALVRSTQLKSWPGGWVPHATRRVVYSQRVIAAGFLMELNRKGPLQDRFLFREIKSTKGTMTFASLTTYLGKTAKPYFDLSFEYKKGVPQFPKYSLGKHYASWSVKNTKGHLVYPDASGIISWKPPFDATKTPGGLKDGLRRGHTCRELTEMGFFEVVASDFNIFIKEIYDKLDMPKHTHNPDSASILYMDKNTSIPVAIFGAWFAYIKSNGGPPNRKPKGKWDSDVIDALADFFDKKANAQSVSGSSTPGGLYKDSDGKGCEMNYSGGTGQKTLTSELINVMNLSKGLSSGDAGFTEL